MKLTEANLDRQSAWRATPLITENGGRTIDTTRRFKRSRREAFPIDWTENCLGVERPIQTEPSLWERLVRLVRGWLK